jgi:3-hydroxyacyl-CoA dehydrogenase
MRTIQRVAVLGAGTMGARIAAHFANAGVPSYLLDIVIPNQPNRNAAALKGIESTAKGRPGGFFVESGAALITPGNFEDDLAKVAECDWIIEAVTENLEVKRTCGRRSKRCASRIRSYRRTPAAFRCARFPKASPTRFDATF